VVQPFTGRSRVHFMTRRSVLPIGTVGGAEVTADSAERGVCSAARTASQEDGRILGICSGSCLERRGSRNARACATAGEPEGGSRRAAAKGGSRIGRRGPSCGIWRANPRGRIGSEDQQPETWHNSVRARRSICANENVWHLSCQGRMCAGAKIRRQARLRELSCALPLDCPADLWYKYR